MPSKILPKSTSELISYYDVRQHLLLKCSRGSLLCILRCLLSRENLNSTFSALYIKMTITFDLLDRFQENKVLQTAQTMNNILSSKTKW